MRRALVMVAAVFCLSGMVAATGHAGTVYMSDGETTIDCQSVSRQGGKVYVQVNRDILLEFSQAEVDMARTFRQQPGSRKKKSISARPEGAAAVKTAAVATPAKPAEAVEAKAPAATLPAAKPAAPAPAASPNPVAPTAKLMPAANTAVTAMPAPQQLAATVKAVPAVENSPFPVPLRSMLTPGRPAEGSAIQPIALPAAAAGMLKTVALVCLFVLLLMIISLWQVFEKAGEPGWACLVPIYNMVVLLNMAGKPVWWLLLLFIPLVNLIIYLLVFIAVAERFGKGALFGLGLFLFGFIFWPVLAFDGSAYQG